MKRDDAVIFVRSHPQALTFAAMIVAAAAISYFVARAASGRAETVTAKSLGPTVKSLEGLSQIASVRVHVADVLTAEGEGYRGWWLIKGDALLACDLSRASIVTKDDEARRATVRMPPPRVVSPRVDHERTKTWSVELTTWQAWAWGN